MPKLPIESILGGVGPTNHTPNTSSGLASAFGVDKKPDIYDAFGFQKPEGEVVLLREQEPEEPGLGERFGEAVFGTAKDAFDYVVDGLAQTNFFKEAAAGLNAMEDGKVEGGTLDYLGVELLENLSEISKSVSGRGMATVLDTFVAQPLNFLTRATYGESNPIGDFVGGFADVMRETYETETSRAIAEQEFGKDKILNPDFWFTSVAETVPLTLSFLKVGTAIAGGLQKFTGTSKFAQIASTIVGGTGMRSFESMAESEQAYEEAIARGMSDAQAIQVGSEVFRDNMLLVGTDVPQLALALIPFGRQVGSTASKILKTAGALTFSGGSEAFEEMYQLRSTSKALGDEFDWFSPESLESGFIGAVSGVGFQVGGNVSQRMKEDALEKSLDNYAAYLGDQELSDQYWIAANNNVPNVLSYRNADGERVHTPITAEEHAAIEADPSLIPASTEESQIVSEKYGSNVMNTSKEVSRKEFIEGHSQASQIPFTEKAPKTGRRYEAKLAAWNMISQTNADSVARAVQLAEQDNKNKIQKAKELYTKVNEYLQEKVDSGDISAGLSIRDVSERMDDVDSPVAKLKDVRNEERLLKEQQRDSRARGLMKFFTRAGGETSLAKIRDAAIWRNKNANGKSEAANLNEIVKSLGFKSIREAQAEVSRYRQRAERLNQIPQEKAEYANETREIRKNLGRGKKPALRFAKNRQRKNIPLTKEEKALLAIENERHAETQARIKREKANRQAKIDRVRQQAYEKGLRDAGTGMTLSKFEEKENTKKFKKRVEDYIANNVKNKVLTKEQKADKTFLSVLKKQKVDYEDVKRVYKRGRELARKNGEKAAKEALKQEKQAIKELEKQERKEERIAKKASAEGKIEGIRMQRAQYEAEMQKNDVQKKTVYDFIDIAYKNKLINKAERNRLQNKVGKKKKVTKKGAESVYKEVNKVIGKYEKKLLVTAINKLFKKAKKAPGIAIDYKEQMLNIMPFMGSKKVQAEAKRVQELLVEAANNPALEGTLQVPQRLLNIYESTKNLKRPEDLTVRQLQGIYQEAKLLEHLGRVKVKQYAAQNTRTKEHILAELALGTVPIQERFLEPLTPSDANYRSLSRKMAESWNNFLNGYARMGRYLTIPDVFFDWLDGSYGTFDGANTRLFKRRIDYDWSRYLNLKDSLENILLQGLKDNNLTLEGKLWHINSEERRRRRASWDKIGFFMVYRQQDSKSKGIEKLEALGYTREQIEKEIAVGLTKEEMNMVEIYETILEKMFPQIQEVMRKLYNKKVEWRKDYFPFEVDPEANRNDFNITPQDGEIGPWMPFKTKKVPESSTKSRKGGKQAVKINSLEVMLHYIDNNSYLITMGETVKQLTEVVNDDRYQQIVGKIGKEYVSDYLNDLAKKGGVGGSSRIVDFLRKNVGAGILGLKVTAALIQWTALIDGAHMLGAGRTASATKTWLENDKWRAYIREFPELRDRLGGELAIAELNNENFWQGVQQAGYGPLKAIDSFAAGAILIGAYEQRMKQLGIPFNIENVKGTKDSNGEWTFTEKPNQDAMDYAQRIVRLTQSSAQLKDLPPTLARGAITGSRSIDRMIFQFQNFLLGARWNRLRHMFRVSQANLERAGGARKAGIKGTAVAYMPAEKVMAYTITATLVGTMTRQMYYSFMASLDDEDDRDVQEEMIKSFMFELTGNVPFAGNLMAMGAYDSDAFPVMDTFGDIVNGTMSIATANSDEARARGYLKAGSNLLVLVPGIPGIKQSEQILRVAIDNKFDEDTRGGRSSRSGRGSGR